MNSAGTELLLATGSNFPASEHRKSQKQGLRRSSTLSKMDGIPTALPLKLKALKSRRRESMTLRWAVLYLWWPLASQNVCQGTYKKEKNGQLNVSSARGQAFSLQIRKECTAASSLLPNHLRGEGVKLRLRGELLVRALPHSGGQAP